MKKILCICVMMIAGGALAWGPGHDVVARCVLERLPAEWRARFKPEWMKPYLAASHLPDNGSLKLLRPEDLEWLRTNCGLKDKAFPLHYPPGLLGSHHTHPHIHMGRRGVEPAPEDGAPAPR